MKTQYYVMIVGLFLSACGSSKGASSALKDAPAQGPATSSTPAQFPCKADVALDKAGRIAVAAFAADRNATDPSIYGVTNKWIVSQSADAVVVRVDVGSQTGIGGPEFEVTLGQYAPCPLDKLEYKLTLE